MMRQKITLSDISKNPEEQLLRIHPEDLMPLPSPCGPSPKGQPLPADSSHGAEGLLDGTSALGIAAPKDKQEEEKRIEQFLGGLRKLLSRSDNWAFWQPLIHTLESCVRCQVCSDACHAYLSSGRQEIYRPTYRAEILRRIVKKYIKKEKLNWSANEFYNAGQDS